MDDSRLLIASRYDWRAFCAARQRVLALLALRHYERTRTMGKFDDFVSAWNTGDPAAVAAHFADNGVRHQMALPEARLTGRAAIEQGIGMITNAVPDGSLELVAESVGEDGRATFEWVFRGTHTNDLPGLPANGAAFALPGISHCTFDDQGKIAEERVYWDTATVMAAAGMLDS